MPRRRQSGFARQQQIAFGLLFCLGGLFGGLALTGGIQMLLSGEASASYSTARAGAPYRLQSSFGPATPILLGCVLLIICVLVLVAWRRNKNA